MGKSVRDPLTPQDFFSQFDSVPNTFGNVHIKETTRQLPAFNPKEYENVPGATPYDDPNTLDKLNARNQPISEQVGHGLTQFGANFASGFGQGLANLVDISSWGNDNYQSNLFGLSTKDMQDWSTGVAQRNDIKKENPGEFQPGSMGWWMEQVGSAGTGVGMGAFALVETVGLEALTGGLGTGAAISRLGSLFNRMGKAGTLAESATAIKDLRSAATAYGVLNRVNESRMEAMQSYQDIYDSMAKQKNPDSTAKYTDEQLKKFASEGASKTFYGNMALLPLDILAFRTMVFNPISGSGEGLIEKTLGNIGNKAMRKAAQYGTGAFLEGTEEGFQKIVSDEGKHYAQVLGGEDDGSTFLQRLGTGIASDDFWNNFAGGVIGSPIIGGVMNMANKIMTGNRTAMLNQAHENYIKTIGRIDNITAEDISTLQSQGKTKEADILRRQFRADKALGALHLDAMTDKNAAFNAHINFLQGTLDEVNSNKLDALQDLGFTDPTPEQVQYIKDNFQDSINDANELKSIYDNVATKYNKNFVPQITEAHFRLNKLIQSQSAVNESIIKQQAKLFQYKDLSDFGKEQYNAEYSLASLIREQARLQNQYKQTEDTQEKEAINQVMDSNKTKITEVKNRLDEISKDEAYQPKQKSTDKEILDSALRDPEYLQAVSDKTHLDNAISLQRKNISLWNNKEYQTKKTKQSISKAKTTQQVDNNKEELEKKNELTPEIEQTLQEKTNEIKAQEISNITNDDATIVQNSPGLFEQDKSDINNIKSILPVDDKAKSESQKGEVVYLLAPASVDFDNSPDDAKNKLIMGIKGLVSRTEGEPSFEKLVRHVAAVDNIETADTMYNALKWGWERAGFKTENYDLIYNKIFGNPTGDILSGLKGLRINTPEQLVTKTEITTASVVTEQSKPDGYDNNNQPIYTYKGRVTNESSPKLAFLTRLSELEQTKNDDGSITVSHDYTETELNTGDYVNSLPLLDPDKFTEGTKVTAKVPDNFNDIKIPVYNIDGSKGKSVTFGEYVAQKNLTPSMQEYKDKLPIIIYAPGLDKGVAFVHDIGWYHPLRFNQQFKNDMDDVIKHTRQIRESVINGDGALIITSKRQTTFAGLKTNDGKNYNNITLKEANPDSILSIALNTSSLSTSKSNQIFPNNETVLMNTEPLIQNDIYDVRRYGTDSEGKKTYMAFQVLSRKLDILSHSSVLQAINIYANRSNINPDIRAQHKVIIDRIQTSMGLDILSPEGLEKYLNHFIYTFRPDKAYKNEDVEIQAKSRLAPGTPYISFIAGGNIVFGRAGQPAFVNSSTGKAVNSRYINPNVDASKSTASIKALGATEMLGWFRQNVNLNNLTANKPVVTIDQSLKANITSPSYKEHLLDRLETNIRSHNIGTKEEPNYVTNIQPIITYDLKSNLSSGVLTNEEQKQEILNKEEIKEIPTGSTNTETQNLLELLKERAKRNLGNSYGVSRDELFAPAKLNINQREGIARSINRIAGLRPDEQEDIVSFMYNQVVNTINFENNIVSKSAINEQVEDAYNTIVEAKKLDNQNEIARIEELVAKYPILKDAEIDNILAAYKNEIAKINSIKTNLNILKEKAFDKVSKYTGITENKVSNEKQNDEEETEANPNESTTEETSDKERDFWIDILQESPDSRLSYAMRRFFGSIREYNKDKTLKTGFLNLTKYVGAGEVTRRLMVTLADIPSDFNSMINKLKSVADAIPWMWEVINKLEGATQQQKNQFVTVMSNTSLRMKFMMISFNNKTKSYTTKVWDTHLTGVADAIRSEWNSNFKDSELVLKDGEFNVKRAQALVNRYNLWTGSSIEAVPLDMTPYRDLVNQIRDKNPVVKFAPGGDMLTYLKSSLPRQSSRVRFSLKGQEFQIEKFGEAFQISRLNQMSATKDELRGWLKEFGIILSPDTFNELMDKGLYHNYAQRSVYDLLNNENGLFKILNNSLVNLINKPDVDFTEEGNIPLENSVIKSLATLESKYNQTTTPFGFRDNGKSYFALTLPKFITDRVRDLKMKDSVVRKQLASVSFSKNSFWLSLLSNQKFLDKFNVSHIGANAFKELGKRLYKDNAISKLADVDHELTKLGMFWDTTQGELEVEIQKFPGTDVTMRMGTMFSPTMSDKHIMTLITTAVLNLNNSTLQDGRGITKEVNDIIYEQTIKPELLRMINSAGKTTNIKDYDKGKSVFLMMPAMNDVEFAPGLKLVDYIKHSPGIDITNLENNDNLKKNISAVINEYVNTLTDEKLSIWTSNGLLNDKKEFSTIDKKYSDKFRGTPEERSRMFAMDYIINYLISNANSFMTMAGDPALYYKEKQGEDNIKYSWINAGKRLANQIAPGTTLANSENEKYIQIFINDRHSISENIAYLERLLGVEGARAYRDIEGADAQEYTTWKEHLDILSKMGKTPDTLIDITPEDIQEARELFSSDVTRNKLTDKQMKLISKVMQPMKPAYTGQIHDAEQDVMRTVYIKSSSFPLIPQLTAGMQIDKLREEMEKIEKKSKMNVRASYQSANKVGALSNPATIWNKDGDIDDAGLKSLSQSSMILDRKNFRIQQDVPYKSGKQGEDKISLGTQLMKLLFGDEIMNQDGFMYNNNSINGKALHKIYNDTFIKLVNEKKSQLFNELGLDDNGTPVDYKKSTEKLHELLKAEAIKRGYPLQDIEGLELTSDGDFNMPLWASTNSNRYESMLNSIVGNRLIKIKFPGTSSVVGSEEGFRIQKDLEGVNKSKIIYTDVWNGSHLTAVNKIDGELKKAQVFISSKFKDNEGNLVDLFKKTNGEYVYITQDEKGFHLNHSMFDRDLLSSITFRIPTSGHQSASQVEIAGFLPAENADLMIVPRNFTKQKGLDFDIDKENSYNLWSIMNEDGKFETLKESHRSKLLSDADREVNRLKDNPDAIDKLLLALGFGDGEYTEEDIRENKVLTKLNSKINEKLLQNELIKINHAVMGNPSDLVQSKINRVLSTDYAEQQASFIDNLSNSITGNIWTPLSDEYQKQKLITGASGKIGTGAYSLDVVFHSLAQQARINGRPIQLIEVIKDGEDVIRRPKEWRFGNLTTTGELGGTKTIDGSRSVSEVNTERQNIAVDNEKLQVMGRVNLNDITMDVDKVMNLIGFDKGSDGNSISFLFLSQPIVKDFVKELKNAKSNLADYSSDREGTVFNKLISKYEGETKTEINDDYWNLMSSNMTNENFISNIAQPDGALQGAILRRFMEMRKYGQAIRGIQVSINTDSKGLGKSFFDVIEKRNSLNRLGTNSDMITEASGLIGEYIPKDDRNPDDIKNLTQSGYTDIGNFLVRPDTLSGGFSIQGVNTAYNLWSKYFPYDADVTQKAFSQILPIIAGEDDNDTKTVELKQEIFRGMKKYFSASKVTGIIAQEDDINQERSSLYIDSEDNTSLAKYLKTLRDMTGNNVVNTFIKSNKLLNRFEYDINKNGQPSLIKYNSASGEEFDEQYLYESLTSLLEVRGKADSIELPTIGNKSYTLDTLAQALITYAYLGNATQEAIQFTKYVPLSYLNQIGYAPKMRSVATWLREDNRVLGITDTDETTKHLIGEYPMQYIQHNPERVKFKKNEKELKALINRNKDGSFTFKDGSTPTFVSIYNSKVPKGEKKFNLYWFDGAKFVKIPVLGVFGMDEYQPRNYIGQSLINGKLTIKADPQPALASSVIDESQPGLFNIDTGDAQKIIQSISDTNTTQFTELAKHLSKYVDDNLRVELSDSVDLGGKTINSFMGHYNPETNIITISNSIINDSNKLADIFLHEVIHALTYKEMQKYTISNSHTGIAELTSLDTPGYVEDMVRMYNSLRLNVDNTSVQQIKFKVGKLGLTDEETSKFYGYVNIHEFMTMALTNKGFQDILNTIPYKDTGRSILDVFKDIIKRMLSGIGVKFDEDFTAAHAVSTIFNFIEEANNNNNNQSNEFDFLNTDPDNDPSKWEKVETLSPEILKFC